MRLVFLDVGAHDGQTLEEVTKAEYGFDHIVAFEPMPQQFAHLIERFGCDSRVHLCRYGLSDVSSWSVLYGTNDAMEASIYAEKRDADQSVVTSCEFVAASEIVGGLPADCVTIMKLNCEGAEIPILNNLVDTGAIFRLHNVMIDFDIRKVPGREHEEAKILERFREIGFSSFSLSDEVMQGPTHQDRIANWLRGVLSRA